MGGVGSCPSPQYWQLKTDRLLNDPRSSALTKAFVTRWLGLDGLDFFELSLLVYPRFDSRREARGKDRSV